MITIYESTQTGVPSHMGLGALTPSSCLITEDLNGQFSLAMTHPIDDNGKWLKIENGRIIKAPTHRGLQLFRIYNSFRDPVSQKTIVVQARHIFYNLLRNFLEDVRPDLKNGQDFGRYILAGCQTPTEFTFYSDIAAIQTAYYIRKNPVAAFIGTDDQSFINRFGCGEIERDNYIITINTRTGSINRKKIAYAKNIAGLDITVDDSLVVTRVMPTALDKNNSVITTDVKYYDSPRIGNYYAPYYGQFDTGIRVGQEVSGTVLYPDDASAKAAMATMAAAYFAAGADVPKITLNVTYADLSKTDQYAQYADLFSIGLGDDVNVYYPAPQNIDIDQRVISVKWDAIEDKMYNCVIGDFEPNIAKSVVANDIDISALKTNMEGALREGESYNGMYADHTKGYWTQLELGDKTVEVRHNGQDGFAFYVDNVYKGGIKLINSEVGFIGNILMNDPSGDCYATIGSFEDGGTVYNGIFIYRKVSGLFALMGRIIVNDEGSIHIYSASGSKLVLQNGGEISMYDANRLRGFIGNVSSRWISPNGNNEIGVNDTAAFKKIGAATTPL